MKLGEIVSLVILVVLLSCASGPVGLRNAEEIVDISNINKEQSVSRDNAKKILNKYIINFKIPNPLYGDYGESSTTYKPNHESTINCRAVLLDDFSTEADIMNLCSADSLQEEDCLEYRNKYIEKNLREGMFRIRIEMESGFSEKSMDPAHWAIYLENSSGVMIEPFDITNSSVTTISDSVFSDYYEKNFQRRLLKRNITLYFKETTFFGEDLLSEENPFLVLVFSREKKTVARIAWKTTRKNKS